MRDITDDALKIVVAVVSNPNFFNENDMPENKLQLVENLIKRVNSTVSK